MKYPDNIGPAFSRLLSNHKLEKPHVFHGRRPKGFLYLNVHPKSMEEHVRALFKRVCPKKRLKFSHKKLSKKYKFCSEADSKMASALAPESESDSDSYSDSDESSSSRSSGKSSSSKSSSSKSSSSAKSVVRKKSRSRVVESDDEGELEVEPEDKYHPINDLICDEAVEDDEEVKPARKSTRPRKAARK